MDELVREFLRPGSAAWAVRADELQARGDPRGELIAIEQRLDGPLPERERAELEAVARRLRAPYIEALWQRLEQTALRLAGVGYEWRFGYLSRVDVRTSHALRETLAAALDGGQAEYLAELRISLYGKHMPLLVEVLSAAPRPLRSLTLDVVHAFGRDEPISANDGAALMQALPHLRSLELSGRRSFARLDLPKLESLRLSGHDAIVDLHEAALPKLRALDLALVSGWGDDRGANSGVEPDWLAAVLDGPATPGLRHLDLSRNNPGAHEYTRFLGGREPGVLFEVLARTSVCAWLERLELPSPNDSRFEDAVAMLGLVARLSMPRLYTLFSPPRERLLEWLPSLAIELEVPHRPEALIDAREKISATVVHGSERSSCWVSMRSFSRLFELRRAQLGAAARAVLDRFSARFAALDDANEEFEHELASLRSAAAELLDGHAEMGGVADLLDLLDQHAHCCTTVTIAREWE